MNSEYGDFFAYMQYFISGSLDEKKIFLLTLCWLLGWLCQVPVAARRVLLCHRDLLWCMDPSCGVLAEPAELLCGMCNLSSLTRDWTCVLCIARQILNHWTTKEILVAPCFNSAITYLAFPGAEHCTKRDYFFSSPLPSHRHLLGLKSKSGTHYPMLGAEGQKNLLFI